MVWKSQENEGQPKAENFDGDRNISGLTILKMMNKKECFLGRGRMGAGMRS